MADVMSIANTENVNSNIAPVQTGKRVTPVKLDTLPETLKPTVQPSELEEVEEDDFISEEEFDDEEDQPEEEEENEDEEQDALPEGCLAPEHEAMEASLYAEQLGFQDVNNAIEFVGQNSWQTYEKVVNSYYKMIESEIKETEYDACANDANQMNQRVDQAILALMKEYTATLPSSVSAMVATRDVVYSFIEKVVQKAYLFTENRGDYVITSGDIVEALRLMNPSLLSEDKAIGTQDVLFGDLADYNSADDEDYVDNDEDMVMDQEEPYEWDSEVEEEEEQKEEENLDEEEEEENVHYAFDKELVQDVVDHFINVLTPSDDPESIEQEQEESIQEVDVEEEGIEYLQQVVQDFVSNLLTQANKLQNSQSPSHKRGINNKDIKFVLDFCPELHF